MAEDELEAAATAEEKRAAANLRAALEPDAETAAPRSSEGRWLAAHLRLPTAEDSLGEVRAWRLARAARESVQSRRRPQVERRSDWKRAARLGRSLTSTGGLLGAAATLLIVSWLIVGQGQNGPAGRHGAGSSSGPQRTGRIGTAVAESGAMPAAAAQALLLRSSLLRKESPVQRLDLMIQARLAELRSASLAEGGGAAGVRGPTSGAISLLGSGPQGRTMP